MSSPTTRNKKRSPLIVLLVVLGLAGACVPCTGVLAAIAIPSFINYVRRAKAAEARANVEMIARSVVATYETERLQPDGTIARRLPAPLPSTPPHHGAERNAWPPDADPGWAELGFSPPPTYYSYEYAPDLDGDGFAVRARGDLDADGIDSLFEVRGRVDPVSGEIALDPIEVENELE